MLSYPGQQLYSPLIELSSPDLEFDIYFELLKAEIYWFLGFKYELGCIEWFELLLIEAYYTY